MTWKLQEIPRPTYGDSPGYYLPSTPAPGSFFRTRLDDEVARNPETNESLSYEQVYGDQLAPEFRSSGRDYVVAIRLPNGSWWHPDMLAAGTTSGWTVTGDPPNLTANPSVNDEDIQHGYHGWLRDGELSDDLEGRTY